MSGRTRGGIFSGTPAHYSVLMGPQWTIGAQALGGGDARIGDECGSGIRHMPPDLSPRRRKEPRACLQVPMEVAAKGLGPTGAIDIPLHNWDNMSLANFQLAAEGPPIAPISGARNVSLFGTSFVWRETQM